MKICFSLLSSLALGLSAIAQTPAPAAPGAVMAEPEPGPWKVLFDGKTVNGLRGLQKPDFLKAGWKIEDGALTLTKTIEQTGKQTGGDLITADSYTDFDFL